MELLQTEKLRILVVDDDRNICDTLSLILESRGYDVDVARTGKAALEKSKTKAYDLAVLDVRLPDIEGTKLLRRMHETYPGMVKIMLTGYPETQNAIDAIKSGAEAYFTKPVNPVRLIEAIEDRLEEMKEPKTSIEERQTSHADASDEDAPEATD
jgi:DNA-binding NtrC family response regulator